MNLVSHTRIVICGLLLACSLTMSACGSAQTSGSVQATQACGPDQVPKPQSASGMPAITPRLCKIPTYTEQDVRDYLQAHPFGRDGRIGVQGKLEIAQILFVTSKEASQRMANAQTGAKPEAIVCFVELKGDFFVAGRSPNPLSKTPDRPPESISHQGHMIFDGTSGNLLLQGITP